MPPPLPAPPANLQSGHRPRPLHRDAFCSVVFDSYLVPPCYPAIPSHLSSGFQVNRLKRDIVLKKEKTPITHTLLFKEAMKRQHQHHHHRCHLCHRHLFIDWLSKSSVGLGVNILRPRIFQANFYGAQHEGKSIPSAVKQRQKNPLISGGIPPEFVRRKDKP